MLFVFSPASLCLHLFHRELPFRPYPKHSCAHTHTHSNAYTRLQSSLRGRREDTQRSVTVPSVFQSGSPDPEDGAGGGHRPRFLCGFKARHLGAQCSRSATASVCRCWLARVLWAWSTGVNRTPRCCCQDWGCQSPRSQGAGSG